MAFPCFGTLASSLQPKERIPSYGFTEISCRFCSSLSYRESAAMMNRVFHRSTADEVKVRTLTDYIQRVGKEIISAERSASDNILQTFGFDSNSGQLKENVTLPDDFMGKVTDSNPTQALTIKDIQVAIDKINCSRKSKITATADEIQAKLEANPDSTVYISVDHIGVTRQKDVRRCDTVRDTKYVQNCVAHIQQGDNTYSFTDVDTDSLFKSVLAFLLANDLLKYNLIFFMDGAVDLKSKIASFFSFHPYQIILDWFHVEKKTYEMLSMAISGKSKKNGITGDVLGFLWAGDIAGATDYLKSLPSDKIKNSAKLQEFFGYLDRKGQDMTCYAVRKYFNIRISSNRVEKDNDMLVATRQKHNGMAWTPHGSGALAAIEMIYHNNQDVLWFKNKQILGLQMNTQTVPLAA